MKITPMPLGVLHDKAGDAAETEVADGQEGGGRTQFSFIAFANLRYRLDGFRTGSKLSRVCTIERRLFRGMEIALFQNRDKWKRDDRKPWNRMEGR